MDTVDIVTYSTDALDAALDPQPFLKYQPARSNAQIRSNDLADAEWTASNVTVGDQDETGITGSAAAACTLTASAGNGTVIANAITASSATQALKWWIKRKTGTGTIELSLDNGSTWQDVTASIGAAFSECIVEQAALANPQIGIRIVTSGDAVIVGNTECHTAKAIEQIRGLGPIFTTTAAASTDATVIDFDEEINDVEGALYCEVEFSFDDAEVSSDLEILSTTTGASLLYYDADNQQIESTDGTSTAVKSLTVAKDTTYKLGLIWDDSTGLRVCVDGTWGTAVAYDGSFTGTSLLAFRGLDYCAMIRNVKVWDRGGTLGKSAVDALMGA